jgi:hypothetical protein
MGILVQELLQDWLSVWKQDSQPLPALDSTFTPDEQATHEAHLGRFLQSVEKELRDRPGTRSERRAAQQRITFGFTCFAKTCLDLRDSHLELLLDYGFWGVATQLAREARHPDRAISAADIFQACRNAWTACALQALMGRHPMRLTPSIFAYSMLYPYTDNYLDDPSTSLSAKLSFSGRFHQRLEGLAITAINEQEATIWRLVEIIEQEYPRNAWPEVHARLLAIHEAQENSVRMLRFDSSPENVDILRLSFEKGGTSVAADACSRRSASNTRMKSQRAVRAAGQQHSFPGSCCQHLCPLKVRSPARGDSGFAQTPQSGQVRNSGARAPRLRAGTDVGILVDNLASTA